MLPAIIRAEFEYVNPATTQKNDYYGAYNILLFHAFPVSDGFVIHPQVAPAFSRRDALDFVVYFRVELHRIPVFFVEVKTAVTIMHTSARAGADEQMRDRLRQLFDQSLSELRGISALGTKLCFYALDKSLESITPIAIPRNEAYVNDTAPADRWDVDILTDDGYNRFMEVCNEVKALAVAEGVWLQVYNYFSRSTIENLVFRDVLDITPVPVTVISAPDVRRVPAENKIGVEKPERNSRTIMCISIRKGLPDTSVTNLSHRLATRKNMVGILTSE